MNLVSYFLYLLEALSLVEASVVELEQGEIVRPPSGPSFILKLGNDTGSVCNSSTPGVSGFITTNDGPRKRSMFFWLFESKNDPLTDPVILWMSGGPGASSAGYGNLMELGPCRISPDGNGTVDNQYGWNTNASVLFVDQPAGVGFSTGPVPDGLEEASQAMDQFLRQFFVAFPSLVDRDFYIAGESYGGSWVPALAATILKNQHIEATKFPQAGIFVQDKYSDSRSYPSSRSSKTSKSSTWINLKGIMIGNGLIRRAIQNGGGFETACSGSDSPLSDIECAQWAPRAMWCERNLEVCDKEGFLSNPCKEAEELCGELGSVITEKKGLNPYDWRRTCGQSPSCYPELEHINKYLNQSYVKKGLGVQSDLPFKGISFDVFQKWEKTGDLWRSSDHFLNEILAKGVDALIYVGDKDWYCNAAGMRRLVNEGLTWDGHPFFRFRELIPWYHNSKRAGVWKSFAQLTYAEIENAGHLAPFDLPAESLTLITSWVSKRQLPAS